MKKRMKRILGITFVILGIIILLISQVSILGGVIGISEIGSALGAFFGLVFLIVGIWMMALTPRPNARITRSGEFEESIKKIRGEELQKVESTIDKIRRGLGKPEKLKHLPGYSTRITERNRILYDYDENGDIVLTKYDKTHYKGH